MNDALRRAVLAFVLALTATRLGAAVNADDYAWTFPQVAAIADADAEVTELQEQVQKVLDAGHLAPLYISYSDQGSVGYTLYNEPGRIITTLAWAYPHLGAAQQAAVKAYVAGELTSATFAPWAPFPLPHGAGAPRESHGKEKWWAENATWGAKRPVVQTIYGLWLYAYRTGDWMPVQSDWPAIKALYQKRLGDAVLYGTMGAHVAMARLADKFGDGATRAAALANLQAQLTRGLDFAAIETSAWNQAPNWNSPYRDMYDQRMDGSTYRGWVFLNLCPEIGRYLHDTQLAAVTVRNNRGKAVFPLWWLNKASYFNRSWTGDEGSGLVPEVMGMIAPVERWVAQASGATMRSYLRSAPTGIGDCYWLEALVQAIEASGTTTWVDVR